MLLNKANNKKMLRHIFIDLDNYKYHAKPCKFHLNSVSDRNIGLGIQELSAISRAEINISKHLQIKSDEEYYVVFNDNSYGFFINKTLVEKDLNDIKKLKLGKTTIQSVIEELENHLFTEIINMATEEYKREDNDEN